MSVSESTIIFNKMYRTVYEDKEYFFEDILKRAILNTLTEDTVKAETIKGEMDRRN